MSEIFVVDDDADIRAIVGSSIEKLGVAYREFSEGSSAVAACKQGLPDLIVLDIMMPGIDGNEVCRQVRALEGGELVPIIMLTARDSLKDLVSSLGDGADDYLTKPFHYEELQARVRALLRVRDLHLRLQEKSVQLQQVQKQLIEQERQLVVGQMAGTAAHQLGQPLSAILLNCHLLGALSSDDERWTGALRSIRTDAKRMQAMIEEFRSLDAGQTDDYHTDAKIIHVSKVPAKDGAD